MQMELVMEMQMEMQRQMRMEMQMQTQRQRQREMPPLVQMLRLLQPPLPWMQLHRAVPLGLSISTKVAAAVAEARGPHSTPRARAGLSVSLAARPLARGGGEGSPSSPPDAL